MGYRPSFTRWRRARRCSLNKPLFLCLGGLLRRARPGLLRRAGDVECVPVQLLSLVARAPCAASGSVVTRWSFSSLAPRDGSRRRPWAPTTRLEAQRWRLAFDWLAGQWRMEL